MGIGSPELVIDELVRQQKKNLTIIANDTAKPGIGVGKLVSANAVSKAVVSHIGLNREAQQQMMSGGMIIELVPQGTLIERIRAGGCGLGGVLTTTGVGTIVESENARLSSTTRNTSWKSHFGPISRSCMLFWLTTSEIFRSR